MDALWNFYREHWFLIYATGVLLTVIVSSVIAFTKREKNTR